jgi:ABC-type transporter Mla subunit MlaD
VKLRCKIRDLQEELQETDILKKEAESALCGQKVYYLRKQEERDAIREQTEVVLYDRIDKLHKQLGESITDLRQTRNQCEEYMRHLRERHLERDGADVRIQVLEMIARINDRQRKTVEANLRRAVNDLSEKLQTANMQYRKVEAALHGKIRELNIALQDSNNDKEKVETALRGEIKKLEGIIRETQTHQKSGKSAKKA